MNPFVIYLNDHLAASRSALQLIASLNESLDDAELRESLEGLRTEIAADRHVLEDLIRRLGGAPSVVREVGGWIAEQLAQLKLVVDDPANGALRRFEALEILALGIQGKRALWHALETVAPGIPELAGVNFPDLIQRAIDQHSDVEAWRLQAARAALRPPRVTRPASTQA
jgi:hypothetical protein